MPRRTITIIGFLIAVAVFVAAVWWFALSSALGPLADRGQSDLQSSAARLVGQLQRFRQVAVQLADHPVLVDLARGEGDTAAAHGLLLRTADQSGSFDIKFFSTDGKLLSSSRQRVLATEPDPGPAFTRAMTGALGQDHAVLDYTGIRAFSFAAPVFDGSLVVGAVIVRVDVETVEESDWRGEPEAVFFSDSKDVVFVANRSELLLMSRQTDQQRPFISHSSRQIGGHDIWFLDAGRYLPQRAVHLVLPLPVIGMTGEALINTKSAERIASLQAAVAGALCLAFGALWFLATERRRTLARANVRLEERVSERTDELVSANNSLRHEITEREDAEAALKQAQSDLVQAGKLSALGQISAGISHELNQPLMAIRSFSENAEQLLGKGETGVVGQNLSRISELARRMGRIIKNLRAFARQEHEPMSEVDICLVVDAVLELTDPRLREAGVKLTWNRPARPILVLGGEVRLQQVVINLVTNAVDAMMTTPEKHIYIDVSTLPDKVRVVVRDTGPGLDEPEKIFDPFYTTKEVGVSEGMGLGLSISYGLVQSFGGAIRGRNHPEGGAVFTVELTSVLARTAAA